jgi:hypothetical protein
MSEPERQEVKVETLEYLPEDMPGKDSVIWFGYIGFGIVVGSVLVGFAALVLTVVWLLK